MYVAPKLKDQSGEQLEMQQSMLPKERAAPTATWTDPATGLTWAGKDNGSNVDWPQANAYCTKLRLAAYKDWRLPTVEELQEIYDPSVSTQQVFGDGAQYSVHVKGNLKLTGWIWSNRRGDVNQDAWLFKFSLAPLSKIGMQPQHNLLHFDWMMRALCVRRADSIESHP